MIGSYHPTAVGELPPPFASLDDICPPQPKCPDCKKQVCDAAAKMYGLTILPYNTSLPGLPNRTEGQCSRLLRVKYRLPSISARTHMYAFSDCMIETIGKPVFHRYSGDLYGSWMVDALDPEGEDGKKIWTVFSQQKRFLLEYNNRTLYRANRPTRNYSLPYECTVSIMAMKSNQHCSAKSDVFQGNDNVMYNGSFYYFNLGIESVVKYDLATRQRQLLPIPRNHVNANDRDLFTKLYKVPNLRISIFTTRNSKEQCQLVLSRSQSRQENNYVDLAVDENGLWALFGLVADNNTIVLKVDPFNLDLQYAWNISLNHYQVADTFITCGVLYAVDDVDKRNTRIRYMKFVDVMPSAVT